MKNCVWKLVINCHDMNPRRLKWAAFSHPLRKPLHNNESLNSWQETMRKAKNQADRLNQQICFQQTSTRTGLVPFSKC